MTSLMQYDTEQCFNSTSSPAELADTVEGLSMNPPNTPPFAPQKVAPIFVTKGCNRREVMSGRLDGSRVRHTCVLGGVRNSSNGIEDAERQIKKTSNKQPNEKSKEKNIPIQIVTAVTSCECTNRTFRNVISSTEAGLGYTGRVSVHAMWYRVVTLLLN